MNNSVNDLTKDFAIVKFDDIPDLHGFKQPQQFLQQEKYEHRIMAEMKAAGHTNREIAEEMGVTPTTVNYVVKQPWTKQQILSEIHTKGGKEVLDFMSEKAMAAAEVLVAGFEQEKMEGRRDRVDAANKLLDRVFGKPNQPITNHQGQDLTKLSDEELARIATSSCPTATGTTSS